MKHTGLWHCTYGPITSFLLFFSSMPLHLRSIIIKLELCLDGIFLRTPITFLQIMHVINIQFLLVYIMIIMKGYLPVTRVICFTEHFQAKLTKDGRYSTPLNCEVGVCCHRLSLCSNQSIIFYSPHSAWYSVSVILKSIYWVFVAFLFPVSVFLCFLR